MDLTGCLGVWQNITPICDQVRPKPDLKEDIFFEADKEEDQFQALASMMQHAKEQPKE